MDSRLTQRSSSLAGPPCDFPPWLLRSRGFRRRDRFFRRSPGGPGGPGRCLWHFQHHDSASEVLVLCKWIPILAARGRKAAGGPTQSWVLGAPRSSSETALPFGSVTPPPGCRSSRKPGSIRILPTLGTHLWHSSAARQGGSSSPATPISSRTRRRWTACGFATRAYRVEDQWEAGIEAAVDSIALFDERFGAYPYREAGCRRRHAGWPGR